MQGRMPFAYDGTAILRDLEKLRRRSIRTGDCGGVETDEVVKRSKKPFLKALEFFCRRRRFGAAESPAKETEV